MPDTWMFKGKRVYVSIVGGSHIGEITRIGKRWHIELVSIKTAAIVNHSTTAPLATAMTVAASIAAEYAALEKEK